MKYIETFENFTPIVIKNKKPYKVKKNLPTSIQFLQRRIKSLRKRLDDQYMGTPKKGQRGRFDMNKDKNDKIQKLKDLQFKQLKQAEYLKNNPIKESRENVVHRKVYWLVPTDNRLEDSLVKLFKQYTEWDTPVKPVSDALVLADHIRKILKPFGPIMIITLNFSIDILNDKIVRGPSFRAWDIKDQEGLEKEEFIKVGKVNLEDYEINAYKYNL